MPSSVILKAQASAPIIVEPQWAHLLEKLEHQGVLSADEFVSLIKALLEQPEEEPALLVKASARARELCERQFGRQVFVRGLIEISNICANNCYYCGIRREASQVERYHLNDDAILQCCQQGQALGIATFVLQGGESQLYSDQHLSSLIRDIKALCPGCAVTLSLGERSRSSYQSLFEAGADRYLLRHETANTAHYGQLHPPEMSLANRKECLYNLKAIGFQTGCGFMTGSPGQTPETLAEDMLFMRDLQPHMVGIGPFLPCSGTPFANQPAGSLKLTLFMLALTRIMLPKVLLPATTALATADVFGREKGLLSGCCVVMPNLSPIAQREKYALYNHKASQGAEAGEGLFLLREKFAKIDRELSFTRGDAPIC